MESKKSCRFFEFTVNSVKVFEQKCEETPENPTVLHRGGLIMLLVCVEATGRWRNGFPPNFESKHDIFCGKKE